MFPIHPYGLILQLSWDNDLLSISIWKYVCKMVMFSNFYYHASLGIDVNFLNILF